MATIPPHAKKVFQGEIFSVWQWEQELYDGSTAIFEATRRGDYAGMVGVLPDKKILMVRDEQPHRAAVTTTAGGKVESGEKPETAAQRELLEETGYEAGQMEHWFTHTPLSKTSWNIHLFVGRHLKKVTEPKLEGGERVEPLLLTFEQFLELGHDESLPDTYLRVKLLEAKLDRVKRQALYTLLYG